MKLSSQPKKYVRKALVVIGIILVASSIFFLGRQSVYYFNQQITTEQRAAMIISDVGELIHLPQDEIPQVAGITDAGALKQTQPFLVDAEDNDILIIYSQAKIAILYRPSEHKLVSVGPVISNPKDEGTLSDKESISNSGEQKHATSSQE
ncbi:MAG: hypothetical protein RIQ41_375 [Candidatus Parcubacteria bacterium]|jgi:hypothetical protein